jgi:8-oxo-dGTP pyrophosphatase MutT (NUDIX family)
VAHKNFEDFDPKHVAIRAAATLVVIRDARPSDPWPNNDVFAGRQGTQEVSVLLLQRSLSASFVPGAFVFAGGAIDDADRVMARSDPHGGDSDEQTAKIASVRECFEEAGLLPACTIDGVALNTIPDFVLNQRKEVHGGRLRFSDVLASGAISLNLAAIVPFGRWVTPMGPPRRFDTRFFLASAALGQDACEDGSELIASRWMTPSQALADADAGQLDLIFPTRKTLERLRGVTSFADCLRREGITSRMPSE